MRLEVRQHQRRVDRMLAGGKSPQEVLDWLASVGVERGEGVELLRRTRESNQEPLPGGKGCMLIGAKVIAISLAFLIIFVRGGEAPPMPTLVGCGVGVLILGFGIWIRKRNRRDGHSEKSLGPRDVLGDVGLGLADELG